MEHLWEDIGVQTVRLFTVTGSSLISGCDSELICFLSTGCPRPVWSHWTQTAEFLFPSAKWNLKRDKPGFLPSSSYCMGWFSAVCMLQSSSSQHVLSFSGRGPTNSQAVLTPDSSSILLLSCLLICKFLFSPMRLQEFSLKMAVLLICLKNESCGLKGS